jgi:PAS domain S-box-containing protein
MSTQQPVARRTSAQEIAPLTDIGQVGQIGEQYLIGVLESITDAFVSVDTQYRFTYVNRQAEKISGKMRAELLGRSAWEVFAIAPDSLLYRNAHQAMSEHISLEFTEFCPPLNKWFAVRLYPSQNGLSALFQDITESKQAEEILQQSERRFRALIENSTDAIVLVDTLGTMLYASPSTTHLLGYTPEELVGHAVFEFVHPDDLEKTMLTLAGILMEPGKSLSVEYRAYRKDGSLRWMEGTGTNLLHDPSVQAIVGNYRDITERKLLEEEVRKAKEELETIFHNVADGITVQDAHGTIVYANDAAAILSGFANAEAMLSASPEMLRTHLSRFEIKDEMGNPLSYEQLPGRQALQGEKYAQATIQYYDTVTGKTRWSLVKAQPILDAQGQVQLAVNVFTDITERKELEQRKDEFIGMAGHELKTPLTTIKGFTQVLHRRFKKQDDEESLRFLAKMDTQVNKLTALINDLLDISKIQTGKLVFREELFDLDEVIQDIVENLQAATSTHQLRLEGKAEAQIFGDRDRVGQVLTNLLTNAIKYSPKADTVIVRASRDHDKAMVSVQDFGIGIDAEHQQKIFERFYQVTDPLETTFPGLGIGLYISSQIVKRHYGHMWVESRKGQGSTFSFTLPVTNQVGQREF